MRVQQGEAGRLRQHRGPARAGIATGRLQVLRAPRPLPGPPAVHRQEHRTRQRQGTGQPRARTQRLRHAQHAGADQHRIGHDAQNSTTLPTCSRRKPWRSTKAFCAPMATISPRLSEQALDEDVAAMHGSRAGGSVRHGRELACCFDG
jgi:hypothetical protein